MSLTIRMIGTGSAFAKKYFNNNALVDAAGGRLLIDCGVTAPHALHALRIPLDTLDAVLISHIHADHIGGLEELAFQLLYIHKRKIKLLIADTLVDVLWNHSLRGGLENREDGLAGLHDYFEVIPLQEGVPYSPFDGLRLKLLRTAHIPNKASYSILLGDSVFYSADARFDAGLLHSLHAQGVRHILHDCQLFSPGTVHASLDELLTLPEELQEKVLLMHYGDNMPEYMGRTGRMAFMEQGRVYPLN
ncbi:beta-lactamase domain-containing protein [Paenibacillus mucilaginosus 3016]|uniref:Beta-lactamase domain-containing protein n=1 Tax=Paenibacillus mucilaginosus 3016 TaxID=1116391 RepID=H6NB74_9BACL|nr:MBL fold metallo-hydrolase [Paenibacillus mucilaginosus]AFC32042.1 beta-lactamase domain-containing protein [Paenibacillus mucilaginosus 3016]WFA20553.1 MBL fold metallo-hydrolase [Paenibacillus mucilaginosus]